MTDKKKRKLNFKNLWKKSWEKMNLSATHCLVCGKKLYKNHPKHIVFYCSKKCRAKRLKKEKKHE